jgi:hypothetical protein
MGAYQLALTFQAGAQQLTGTLSVEIRPCGSAAKVGIAQAGVEQKVIQPPLHASVAAWPTIFARTQKFG